MLKIGETAGVLVSANKEAAKESASIVAGRILNKRVAKIVAPKLPLMVRSYAQTQLGEAVLANVVAGVLIHVMPENAKVQLASNAMIQAASLELLSSFNIEEMIDELLDGVKLPEAPETAEAVKA